MAITKRKGDVAEAVVIADALKRGYRVAIPLGEDWPFDLIVERHSRLERVQCKYTVSDGTLIKAKCRSTNGWLDLRYTSDVIDWLAIYDATSDACYYVPAEELGDGRTSMNLRLEAPKNGQAKGIRWAESYRDW